MKTKKKAILGMLVAMVLSLGAMGGMNAQTNDVNVQQAGGVCAWIGDSSENHSGTWYYAAGVLGGAGTGVGYGALVNSWNPFGWVGWAVAGVCLA